VDNEAEGLAMENVRGCRAMVRCSVKARYWTRSMVGSFLGDAERWEHLAELEIAHHFNGCNTASSNDLTKSGVSSRERHAMEGDCRRRVLLCEQLGGF
jgi:hypothetical protein